MTITISSGAPAAFAVTVQRDGRPVPIPSGAPIKGAVLSADGRSHLVPPFDVTEDLGGAAWGEGVVSVQLTADQVALIPGPEAMFALTSPAGIKRYRLVVEQELLGTRTSLFVKDIIVDEIRTDRLMAAAAGILQDVQVSDEYLWGKVQVAEAEMAHTLRVPLVPTKFFPHAPTPEQIAALDGMAWGIDPGYDYDPTLFQRDKWGYMVTRNRPLIAVERLRMVYPTQDQGYFDMPQDWLRLDEKYGHVRIVPSSNAMVTAMSGFGFSALAAGNVVPSMMQLYYTAGLTDAARDFPELVDAIKKMAVLKIVGDAFLPQSGSISADGLSQSLSVDMSKYSEMVDETINGAKGSNGGLMAKLHGIRLVVA